MIGMADGYARFSGKIGLATTTQGPGYTNATTSVVLARLHRSPVLMLAGHASLRDPYNPQGEAEAAAWQGRLVRPSRGRDPGVDACERGHHARGDRRDHRFGPLRGCAGARSEAVPERSHLSGVHGAASGPARSRDQANSRSRSYSPTPTTPASPSRFCPRGRSEGSRANKRHRDKST